MKGKYSNLDTTGEVCPVPLIKTRKYLDKLNKGEILIVTGDHEESKSDIITTTKELGMKIMKVEADNRVGWRISIKRD